MFHDARTSNSLNGAQVVLSEQFMYWKGWTIDGIAKAGAYHNQVKASVSETYIGTDPGPGGDSSPEQYAGVTGPTFVTRTFNADTHGEIIAHGGNAGLQFSY